MMNVCDAAQPRYLPELVLDVIFSNLEPSDLYSCMLVCRKWNRAINSGRPEPWKSLCLREFTEEFLNSNHLSQLRTHKDKLRFIYYNSWNPKDCSVNIAVKNHGFTFVRNLTANSTDMVRTKTGYNTGKHVWEITWNEPLGTVAMVGVSTKEAPLQCSGYIPLLGSNEHSWGWNLVDNVLEHDSISHGYYPRVMNRPQYKIGEKLLLVLDCENRTLHFEKCNVFLGIAFRNLPSPKLYPSVSVAYGNSNVSILYIGNRGSTPRRNIGNRRSTPRRIQF